MGGCATKQFPPDSPITRNAHRAIKPEAFEHDASSAKPEAEKAPTSQVETKGKNEEHPLIVETKVVTGETSKGEESVTPSMADPKEEKNGVIEDTEKNVPDNIGIDGKDKSKGVSKTEAAPETKDTASKEEVATAPKTEAAPKEVVVAAPKEEVVAATKEEAVSADKSETKTSSAEPSA
ncbi:hypothetical protein ZOSMA_30G00210 [Zostera marina]|uniref:Uncharacterized protein n=1 Tax=Zostera marina TaxID=29655 RepID=A0A0K9PC12_ZOSMR|nr:hypothetical protein ZOSMA_30G00210 [Zostera marina]